MLVMIRMPEGRLTYLVPRQLSSLVMSGKIGLNLSPLQALFFFSSLGLDSSDSDVFIT